MKATLHPPIKELRGKIGDHLVARVQNGQNQLYPMPELNDPRTPAQLGSRGAFGNGSSGWSQLVPEVFEVWNTYAAFYGGMLFEKPADGLRGQQLFTRSAKARAMLGLGPLTGPPHLAPPPLLTGAELMPAGAPDEFAFTVHHYLGSGEGHMLVLKLTPPVPRLTVRPRRDALRLIHGEHPASAVALPPSGGVAVFSGVPLEVPPGRRFLAALRVVRISDGVSVPERVLDLVRK